MDNFTETTTTSFLSNITNSIKGILLGFALIIGSIFLLSYNEHRSINQALALGEMQGNIVLLANSKYDIQYEKLPVFLQETVLPISPIEDKLFSVKSDALILNRHVEMYQWVEKIYTEEEKNAGGSTTTTKTYDYVLEWSSHPINSSSFKHRTNHENPNMKYTSKTYMTDANMGDFYLSRKVIANFSTMKDYEGLHTLPDKIGEIQNFKDFLYKGEDPQNPILGDIKISYTETPKGMYTIAAMQENKMLVDYLTKNNINLLFVRDGKVSSEQIFKEEFDSNDILTWVLRGVGLLLMFFGFTQIMSLLETLGNVIPIFGTLIGGITSIIAGALTLILGSVVIAIAWFTVRPMMSLSIIAVGIGLAVLIRNIKKN